MNYRGSEEITWKAQIAVVSSIKPDSIALLINPALIAACKVQELTESAVSLPTTHTAILWAR